jgi:hypothetical protein
MTVPIVKSIGVTPTERLLADLCERTFLTLWSYPSPCKDDGKELCDLLVVFGDHVFIFFDRESRKFDRAGKDILQSWAGWKKEAIDKQIATAHGAARYLRSGRAVFLDAKQAVPFPLVIPAGASIHKIVVAHGAKEACAAFSEANISGSLAISYGHSLPGAAVPFLVELDKTDIVHVLDSENLEILFGALDTLFDFTAYIVEKERAVAHFGAIFYCGEEDLLAHYLFGYDRKTKRYVIGGADKKADFIIIGEGEWQGIVHHPSFLRRQQANAGSYLWDKLIQETCGYALEGTLTGNADLLRGENALREMAREPRFQRRALSDHMRNAIITFSRSARGARKVSLMPSFYDGTNYVLLQLRPGEAVRDESRYREVRRHALEVACAAAKERDNRLQKVIGIGIDAAQLGSEDFILLDCREWSEETATFYREENQHWKFFATPHLAGARRKISDFPPPARPQPKPGRNAPCTCAARQSK